MSSKIISREDAIVLAKDYLNVNSSSSIVVTKIVEGESIWIILYNSKKYLETNLIKHALIGNKPLVIDRYSSEIFFAPDDNELYTFLENYKLSKGYPLNTDLMSFIKKRTI